MIGGLGGEQLSFVGLKIQANCIRINNIYSVYIYIYVSVTTPMIDCEGYYFLYELPAIPKHVLSHAESNTILIGNCGNVCIA